MFPFVWGAEEWNAKDSLALPTNKVPKDFPQSYVFFPFCSNAWKNLQNTSIAVIHYANPAVTIHTFAFFYRSTPLIPTDFWVSFLFFLWFALNNFVQIKCLITLLTSNLTTCIWIVFWCYLVRPREWELESINRECFIQWFYS